MIDQMKRISIMESKEKETQGFYAINDGLNTPDVTNHVKTQSNVSQNDGVIKEQRRKNNATDDIKRTIKNDDSKKLSSKYRYEKNKKGGRRNSVDHIKRKKSVYGPHNNEIHTRRHSADHVKSQITHDKNPISRKDNSVHPDLKFNSNSPTIVPPAATPAENNNKKDKRFSWFFRCHPRNNWRAYFVILLVLSILIAIQFAVTDEILFGNYADMTHSLRRSGYEKNWKVKIANQIFVADTNVPRDTITGGDEGLTKLSKSLQYLADLNDTQILRSDIPFFFHVPRSGGSTLKDIMGSCLGMIGASDVGAREGHKFDKKLEVLSSKDGSFFVNVDTTTSEGIHRAKSLGLIESHMADYIVTQHLHPAATLFTKNQRGRMFAIFRHPIERAVSLFHYLSVADWEPTYDPKLAFISLEMWAQSKRIEHNWMVRFLSNEIERDLMPRHLEVAKEVLRKKCLVGLLEKKGETFQRFQKYFGWEFPNKVSKECQERQLHWGWSNKHAHPIIEEGSPTWNLLLKKNQLDMELYYYAKQLFKEQVALFNSIEKKITTDVVNTVPT